MKEKETLLTLSVERKLKYRGVVSICKTNHHGITTEDAGLVVTRAAAVFVWVRGTGLAGLRGSDTLLSDTKLWFLAGHSAC